MILINVYRNKDPRKDQKRLLKIPVKGGDLFNRLLIEDLYIRTTLRKKLPSWLRKVSKSNFLMFRERYLVYGSTWWRSLREIDTSDISIFGEPHHSLLSKIFNVLKNSKLPFVANFYLRVYLYSSKLSPIILMSSILSVKCSHDIATSTRC